VWAAAYHFIILGLQLWQPIYNQWKNAETPTIFGRTLEQANIMMSQFMHDVEQDQIVRFDWPSFDCGGYKSYIDAHNVDRYEYFAGVAWWEQVFVTQLLFLCYEKQVRRSGLGGIGILLIAELIHVLYKRLSSGSEMFWAIAIQASGDAGTYGRDTLISAMRIKLWGILSRFVFTRCLFGGDDVLLRLASTITDWHQQVHERMRSLFGTCFIEHKSEHYFDAPYFHGHFHRIGIWFRPEDKALELALMRERRSLILDDRSEALKHDAGISLFRLQSIYVDTGYVHRFLKMAADYIRDTYVVEPHPDDEMSSYQLEVWPTI
jgi:hypothetical protein